MRALSAIRDRAVGVVLRLPPSLLRRLSGGTTTVAGRTLDAQAQMLCALARTFLPHVAGLTPEAVRRQMDESGPAVAGRPRAMAGEDFDLGGGVRARSYRPRGVRERSPLVVYFHGGGFVGGSIRSHDTPVRLLADEARVRVLSVEYRRAPEHKFPAAVDDALRAYLWAREHAERLGADPARIALAGDSAGGNLSASVCHLARHHGLPMPVLQVLIYPATDFTRSLPSHQTFGGRFFLDSRSIDYYLDHYGADPLDERASVLLARRFDGLPPAIVHTAGFDPLVDEGDAYARKLADAGIRVVHRRHDSLIHGFVNFIGVIHAAHTAAVTLAHDVRFALRG